MTLSSLPFTIPALRAAYANGVRPEDVIDEVFARLDAVNDPGIFIHLCDRDDLRAAARALGDFDPLRPLWGIPYAAKDNIDAAGIETTAACPAYAYTPERDAFVIERLRAAGALLIGKTNLDQFATGLVGVRTPYPVPKNALDPAIVPGGSSSGSGVAVGHGLVTFALGTDTAGSGRVPAALNNIVGLKPSLGALSASGMMPACRTLDTISIFALTVDDAWAVYRAAAVYDPVDAYARPLPAPRLSQVPSGLRIGVPDAASREFFGDSAQATSFEQALDQLSAIGAEVTPLDFTPFYDVAQMLYDGAWVAERMAATECLMRGHPEDVHPVTLDIVNAALKLSAMDVFRGMYRLADLKRAAAPLLASVDVLCVPTIPTFCTVAELEADPIGPNSRLGTYTNFVNLLDMCGIAVPTGPRRDGRPGSVTLLASAGRDDLTAALARDLQQKAQATMGATGVSLAAATPPSRDVLASETIVAAVGAHMSGLPLNGQITERGGRYLETTTTAEGYRLFALPGGPPARPGMLRDAGGGQIDLELWAMPTDQVGSFLGLIPAPLGLGKVTLADGRQVTGFLVEAEATHDAEDITALKGWRGYLARQAAQAVGS